MDIDYDLDKILNIVPAMVCIGSSDGYFKYLNPEWEKVTGYSLEELFSQPIFDFIHPDDQEKTQNEINKQEKGKTLYFENRYLCKDGLYKTFEWRATPSEGDKLFAVAKDITESKQAEDALRESEERLRYLYNEAIDGVAIADATTGILVDCNNILAKMVGRYKSELIGKHQSILHPPEQFRGEVSVTFNKHRTDKSGQILDTQILTKTGEIRDVEIKADIIKLDGKETVMGIFRDVTERKRLKGELLKAQKLESVGLFAGGIAHDFNNILTTILGNVSMAKRQVASEDELFEMLSEAEMASLRAQTLTKQLLTFAKGGAPIKETASINDILKESSSFVLRGSKSRCDLSIAEDLWPAEVDVGQMSHVINNIVINANQAMPEGGTIQVAAENLIIENRYSLPINPGRYIKISITDHGVGIAEKYLSKVFDPYFTTKQEGNGLGLATTYSIIKKHNGHITVESQVGVGTTFHIYLPASDKIVPEKEDVKLIKGQGRILVMDDEASLRKMVERMLGNLGYESEFAQDGAEAIRMFKEAKEGGKPYDAVILDLTIPGGMGGKEVIKKLLEIDPELKAIVSSGYSDDPVLANFQDYGFKGMMPKPFESLSLGKVLHEVLKDEKK
ncbi:PAS domain S-box protein [Thermodesulfobacteriota bacterium]